MPEHDDELARVREEARHAREEADRLRHEARTLEQRLRDEARSAAQQERELSRAMRDEARRAADQFGHGGHGPHTADWSGGPGRARASFTDGEQSAQSFSLDGINAVVVDQTAALGLIDELRVAVPEEVRAAKRINSEGERIIEKAQEEAERIVARAQEQAAFLIDERGLTQQAEA